MRNFSVRVAFRPAQAGIRPSDLCVVIDVLRATSTLVTMFAGGLGEAFIAPSTDAARRIARENEGLLLCGEEAGLAPSGFDYGNSPSEFAKLDLSGRRTVLSTTNGTRAMLEACAGRSVLIGSLLNARAVADEIERCAGAEVLLLCSGESGGTTVCLEDVYCAGTIIERLARVAHVNLANDATVARAVYRSFASAADALASSRHGEGLAKLGLAADLDFCARTDVYSIVPRLRLGADGIARVRDNSSGA